MDGDFSIGSLLRIDDEERAQALAQMAKPVHVEKNTILVVPGEVQTQIPILLSGVFRGFALDPEGEEVTDCFIYLKGEMAIGCNPLGEPSFIGLEAITDCEVVTIPVDELLSMLNSDMELLRVYNRYLLEGLSRHWKGKMLMHRHTAMQRYEWFLENYPGLADVVSSKHIASFLGMTTVTVSRLRRELRGGKSRPYRRRAEAGE